MRICARVVEVQDDGRERVLLDTDEVAFTHTNELRELPPEPGDTHVRRAPTGKKTLVIAYRTR